MIFPLVTIAFGIAVAYVAHCRLLGMNQATHKRLWVTFYVLMGVGAGLAIAEALVGRVSLSSLLFLFAATLYLWGSRVTWRDGPPSFTVR